MSKATNANWVTLIVAKDEDGFKHVFRAPGIENHTAGDVVYMETKVFGGFRRKYYEVVSAESFGKAYSGLDFVLSLPGFDGLESVPMLTGSAFLTEYDYSEYAEGENEDGE